MNHTIASDILQYESILREAGVSEKQANAMAKGTAMLMDSSVATKHDIALVKHDIALVHKGIESIRREIRIFGTVIIAGLTLLGLLITVHH